MANITVIVPIHNSESTLNEVLESLEKQDCPISEIFLIDNNSTDHSAEVILAYKKNSKFKITEILRKKDKGLAASYNEAIGNCKGEYLVTLQSDCVILDKNGITKLLEPFADKEVVASCSQQRTPWDIWKGYNFWQKCLFSRLAGKDLSGRNGRFCCFSLPVLKRIGAFDEKKYRSAGEDGDLFFRLMEIGSVVDAKTIVDHLHSRSPKFSLRDYIYKEDQLAEATGACAANNIHRAKVSNYYTPILRLIMVFGLLIPAANLFFLALVILYSIYYTKAVFINEWSNPRILILPLINIILIFLYVFYFLRGFVTKRQKL